MVTREQFIYHMDKIQAYDKLQQHLDKLTGKIGGTIHVSGSHEHGTAVIDLYPMVVEMMNMLDDCLDTPYVNVLDWTMTRKVTPDMRKLDAAEYNVRLIEAWATEMEYGEGGYTDIYDKDNNITVRVSSSDDLYDYLYCSSH